MRILIVEDDRKIGAFIQNGTTYVVRYGPEFEILAKNTLNDKFNASLVVLGKQLFLRGYKCLYCIEE